MEEKIFLQEGNITVTNSRFIVPSQTYAMSGITSVKLAEKNPSKAGPIIFIVTGLLFWLGMGAGGEGFVAGIIFALPGIIWLIKMLLNPVHIVTLTVSSGEVKALESKDRTLIVKVVNALNEAIIYRG